MEINIIVFSNLDPGNGGVETWMHLFLKEVENRTDYFNVVHVHYFRRDGESYQFIPPKADNLQFHPIDIPTGGNGLAANFLALIKFHRTAIKQVRNTHQEIIISIGSYPTGIFNWFFLKLSRYRKKSRHYIWLRTTLSKHIRTHNSRVLSKPIFYFEKKALQDADAVIANGWDTKDNYLKEYGIGSQVVPNAIDSSKYAGVTALSDEHSGPIRIAFIGRFYDSKGIFNFVEAIRIFNLHYPDLSHKVKFVFTGWGDPSIEEFARNTANCELTGKIPNSQMNSLLENIHCGVALTKSNDKDAGGSGVSNNLLELMVTGKIIIAYDNVIYRQFPKENFMLFVAENNDQELAASFARIVEDFGSMLTIAENAKSYAGEFALDQHILQLKRVLQKET